MTKLLLFFCLAWAESLHPCLNFLNGRVDISQDLFKKISAPPLAITTEVQRRIEEPIADEIPGPDLFNELVRAQHDPYIDTHPDKPDEGLMVFVIKGSKIPLTLLELGRLRELTFRTIGAGTGKSRDIDDVLDSESFHVIAWQKKPSRKKISGAYRLTPGTATSLYTPTQFDTAFVFTEDFKNQMVEVSRSIVTPEFQNGRTLKFLLAGIADFVARHPRYRFLIGSASMPDHISEHAKFLIQSFFMTHHAHPLHLQVRAHNPPQYQILLNPDDIQIVLENLKSIKDLKDWYGVTQMNSQKKVRFPPLYSEYHDLGAKFFGFNHDALFQTVDGLLMVDISKIPFEKLCKFMDSEKAQRYLEFHRSNKD